MLFSKICFDAILPPFFWQAKASQVYRELDTMERHGWLTSERIIQNEKPNKGVYTITDSGKEELGNWLSMPESDIADAIRVRNAFLMRVFFAGETGTEQSLEMLRTYREKCMEASKGMSAAYDAISEYGAVVGNDEKSKYWKIAAIYGNGLFHAGLT